MAIGKIRSKGTMAMTFALLSGCTTVGHVYPFPTGSEPAAELKVNGGPVYLLTVNEKGCYTGKTLVDGKPDAAPVKVVPGKLLVLSYEASCLLPFGFTPQQDGRYVVTVSDQASPPPAQTFLQALATAGLNYRTCTARVTDDTDDGHPAPVEARKLSIVHAGLACIKLR
jgi:hypothetical protein